MPKRDDIKSIMIIGAGPIVIGQACEFDYSGTQACKALKDEGYRIILVNSNPATIMTDPDLAHATYIEPITPEIVAQIIEKERPDAILPTMGGQTALNCALSLNRMGVLERFNVELIGARAEAIDKAEDRELFREAMAHIGLETPKSELAHNMAEAFSALEIIGLPAIIRPSFTLGGTGGGIAYNREEYLEIIERGLDASPTSEVLVEQSVLGWKEYEMEVVRDKDDNCIIICSIENIDPMGIHTGDSITIAPALTLTDKEYQVMRNASIAVLREIGVETGGSNVQFAVNPADGRLVVIEMNPRVSRSSALASKATGFPIAKVAARLAVGYTLDELENDITGGATPASFEPTIDYVVTKVPRFAFEKFPGAQPLLTTSMKSVGEAMAIGRTFAESLQKALRSLETGLTGLNEVEIVGIGQGDDKNAIRAALGSPTPDRLLKVAQALRLGASEEQIQRSCHIDPWFIRQIAALVETEEKLRRLGLPETEGAFRALKAQGFSDARLGELTGNPAADVKARRHALGVRPVYKRIDTCAAEFASPTAYMYSTYEAPFAGSPVDEAAPSGRRKVMILGGGPNRIGQGIEFDYCCCHAAFALGDVEPHFAVRRLARTLPGSSRRRLLARHRLVEAVAVDADAACAQGILGKIVGKAVGVVELEGGLAGQAGALAHALGRLVEQLQALLERLPEAGLFPLQHFLDQRLRAGQFGIGVAHLVNQRRHQPVHQRLLRAQQVRMAHGPAHDPAQHIAAPFVRRQDAVGQQEAGGAQMVGDDPVARLAVAFRLDAGQAFRCLDQRAERVDVIVVVHALHDRGNPLQPHARVDRGLGQVDPVAVRMLLVLHEDEVPDLDEPVAILVGAARGAAGDMLAVVVEYLRARTAGAGIAHRPEIVRRGDADDALLRQVRDPAPEVECLVVGMVDGSG